MAKVAGFAVVFLLCVVAVANGQESIASVPNIFDLPSVPLDCMKGQLLDAHSGQPIRNTRIELRPTTVRFKRPHVSAIEIRVGKATASTVTAEDGTFALSVVKLGRYRIEAAVESRRIGGWLELTSASGKAECRLRLELDTNSLAVSADYER